MKKLLTILCSNRPLCLGAMIHSFKMTSNNSDLVVMIDAFDEATRAICENEGVDFLLCDGMSVTQMINRAYDLYKKRYNFFHLSNDDVEYLTPNWDLKLIKALEGMEYGIAYLNDGEVKEKLCSFPVITKALCEKVNFLQHPDLEKYYGDWIWWKIGTELNCLRYVEEAELKHWHQFKTELQRYDAKNETWLKDKEAFDRILKNHLKEY